MNKFLSILLLFNIVKIYSQVSALYTFSETTGTYTNISGGTQLVTTTSGEISYDTDGNNISLPAGSRFTFNGATINSVNMTADGAIWCNPSSSTTGNGVTGPIASNVSAAGVIAAMGMDLRSTSIASQIYERRWQDIGTEVVFQWRNCARYLRDGVERFSFQIRVEKSSGNVKIVYGNMTSIDNSTSYQPQVGLRGTSNADYNSRRLTLTEPDNSPNWGAPNGTTNASSNAHTVKFTGEGSCFPSSGLTFIWTYNGPMENNDACSNAINISLPYSSGLVNTAGSTTDVPTSNSGCATQGNNVWYKVIGNGASISASTCNNSTNFDTEIRVYTGSCSNLNNMVEVECNDDEATCSFSTVHSVLSWQAMTGVEYFLSVGYFSSSGGTGNFILSVNSGSSNSVLPVELINFEGFQKENYNLIKWSTLTEVNNDFFSIERSNDGLTWLMIDNIDGNGNSSTIINYEYKDIRYKRNLINYYRLKQVDFNGEYNYSGIIIINNNKQLKKPIKIISVDGKEVNDDYEGLVIEWYDDGTYEKKIRLNN